MASSSAAASYFAVLLLLLQQRLRAYLQSDDPAQCQAIAAQLRATTGRSHEAFLFSQLFLSGLQSHSPEGEAVFRRLMQELEAGASAYVAPAVARKMTPRCMRTTTDMEAAALVADLTAPPGCSVRALPLPDVPGLRSGLEFGKRR